MIRTRGDTTKSIADPCCVTRGLEVPIEEGIKIEREGSRRVAQTKDAQEGMLAFVQKREPVWRGE